MKIVFVSDDKFSDTGFEAFFDFKRQQQNDVPGESYDPGLGNKLILSLIWRSVINGKQRNYQIFVYECCSSGKKVSVWRTVRSDFVSCIILLGRFFIINLLKWVIIIESRHPRCITAVAPFPMQLEVGTKLKKNNKILLPHGNNFAFGYRL